MFKKLKKRLEVEEGQPALLGKPGTAVRSSINDSSSNVLVESVSDAERQAKNETDSGEIHTGTNDTNTITAQELKEVSQFKTTSQRNGMFVHVIIISLLTSLTSSNHMLIKFF